MYRLHGLPGAIHDREKHNPVHHRTDEDQHKEGLFNGIAIKQIVRQYRVICRGFSSQETKCKKKIAFW
jgi:hypothetical protein